MTSKSTLPFNTLNLCPLPLLSHPRATPTRVWAGQQSHVFRFSPFFNRQHGAAQSPAGPARGSRRSINSAISLCVAGRQEAKRTARDDSFFPLEARPTTAAEAVSPQSSLGRRHGRAGPAGRTTEVRPTPLLLLLFLLLMAVVLLLVLLLLVLLLPTHTLLPPLTAAQLPPPPPSLKSPQAGSVDGAALSASVAALRAAPFFSLAVEKRGARPLVGAGQTRSTGGGRAALLAAAASAGPLSARRAIEHVGTKVRVAWLCCARLLVHGGAFVACAGRVVSCRAFLCRRRSLCARRRPSAHPPFHLSLPLYLSQNAPPPRRSALLMPTSYLPHPLAPRSSSLAVLAAPPGRRGSRGRGARSRRRRTGDGRRSREEPFKHRGMHLLTDFGALLQCTEK